MCNSILKVLLGLQGDTYGDKDTVEVQRFSPTLLPVSSAQYFSQAPGVVDSQDVDVVLAAERLDEGEVDLQGHVLDIFIIGGQDAQNHVIRVSERTRPGLVRRFTSLSHYDNATFMLSRRANTFTCKLNSVKL